MKYFVQEAQQSSRRGSPSQYLLQHHTTVTYRWEAGLGLTSPPTKISALDPRFEIVNIGVSDTAVAGVESSGQVFTWDGDTGHKKHLPGLNGISIVNVAVGEGFFCLVTDRGILLTMGEGRWGCLGHGDSKSLSSPKIVEALLGDDITDLSTGDKHVAVVTSDGEVFTWGVAVSGCLGHGDAGPVVTTPELVDTEEDVSVVVCGREATALIAPDGRILVTGNNDHNRLGLDSGADTCSGVHTPTPSLTELGSPVKDIDIGVRSVSSHWSPILSLVTFQVFTGVDQVRRGVESGR